MDVDTMLLDALVADLNAEQRAAALHGQGPLLIVAGAGTGKTTTLAHRVACRILAGIDPARIMLVTFTRRAAAEMLRRVDAILNRIESSDTSGNKAANRIAARRVVGGTFHSIASRLLRRHGKVIGLRPEFTILDRSDAEDLMNVLRSELELPESKSRFPLKSTCMDIYSRCVNTQQRLELILTSAFPWCLEHLDGLQQLFKSYVDRKETQAVLDYDDLLLFWRALVDDDAGAELIRKQFDCVLVDEYQDTNILQAEILRQMCPDGAGLAVVGDDAQSIYSFRAATVRNILDFPDVWPGTEVVTLEQNYRSTQQILNVTNQVIELAAERHRKQLQSVRGDGETPLLVTAADEDEQVDYVVDQILDRRELGIRLQQQAVLFRASHHSLALEVQLRHRNIPYHKYGGLKFIETAHVKDLLAFLRLAENPFDLISGLRILPLLPGIGRKRAMQFMEVLHTAGGHFDAWDAAKIPAACGDVWPKFVNLMKYLARTTGLDSNSVATDAHAIREFYTPLLEQKYDNSRARIEDIKQIEAAAARFPDRQTFLTEMALDPPSSTQELPDDPHLDEDYLILSTIHSAKGLEWDTVYVIHASDGNIPSDMATGSPEEVEEERRLFYVALTRAKNRLIVVRPERYYFHARGRSDLHSYAKLTRFLPDPIQQQFDRRVARTLTADAPLQVEQKMTSEDVRKRLDRLW